MKSTWIIIFILASVQSKAQNNPINIFRYDDDFTYLLESDSIERKWYEKLKYIPLGKKATVSFGGELREMYQYFDNQNFGDVPPSSVTDTEGFLWHRAMVHADLRISKGLRFFTQLNSTFTFFKDNPLSDQIDENRLSLHQAFLRWENDQGFFVQPGRQEFGKGTELIIGMREGPNTRLTFDALLLGMEKGRRKAYSFIATPVISKQGIFDDEWIDEILWSFYVINPLGKFNLDTYYFGFYGEERAYDFVSGIEHRHTLGLRFWQRSDKLTFSLESIYQFGSFNDLSISAYNLSASMDYSLSQRLNIGLVLNLMSGDESSEDGKLNTYNQLYAKPQFGLAAPIGSTNIQNIRPSISFVPFKKAKLTLSNYWMWRQSENDGLYTPGATQIRPKDLPAASLSERYIGSQPSVEFFYNVNTNVQLFLDYAYFSPGAYIKATGQGKPLQYFSFKTAFKF